MKKVKVVLASALVAASVLTIGNVSAYADNFNTKQDETVISAGADLNEENSGVKIEGEGSNKVLLNITPKENTGEKWSITAYDISTINIEKVGDTTWSITGLSEGTEVVEFYESCPGGESITYIINVDSDLNVTLTEKKVDPNAPIEKKNPSLNVTDEGKKLSVNLKAITTSGCSWRYKSNDDSIVEIEEEKGTLFGIKGLKEGTAEVTFEEITPGGKLVTYIINVDSDLNITFKEKGKTLLNIESDVEPGSNWYRYSYDTSLIRVDDEDDMVWSIVGLKEGTTELKFRENAPFGKIITYTVNVDSNLNVTVEREKDKSNDKENKEETKEATLIKLDGVENSAYDWVYTCDNYSVAEIEKKDNSSWSVTGLKEGTTYVNFHEECPGGKSIIYIVKVDSDLNVTVEKENKTLIKVDIEGLEPEHLVYGVKNKSIAALKREYDNVWSIRGLKEGTTYVTFHEDCPSAKSVTYVIKVDSDLNVTFEKREPTETEKKAIIIKGNKISIEYGKNWEEYLSYEFEDSSIAEIQKENMYEWNVIGLKEGTTKLKLCYDCRGKEYFTYIINVDSDLNVTIKEPKKTLIKIDTNRKDKLNWYIGSHYDDSVAHIQMEDDNLWSVSGLKEGNMEITFYEESPERQTITYAIKIDSDLNATVEEKERGTRPKDEEVNSPSRIKVKENTILIDNEGTKVTGYHWEYKIKDDSVAEIQKENMYEWNVIGLKEGTTEIFVDNNCPGGESATYVINVDSNLNVTLEKKKKESASKAEDVSSEFKVDEKKSDVELKENEPKFDFIYKEENSKPVEIIDEGSFEIVDKITDGDFTLGEDKMDDNIVTWGPDEEEPGSIISGSSVSDAKDEESEVDEVTVEE